jgi:hypothetical protein
MTDGIILNKKRSFRKGIVIERSGRITLRSRPCRVLHLKAGSHVHFYLNNEQMYLLQAEEPFADGALRLSGRTSQLHCCSKDTAKELLRHVTGAGDMEKVELNVSPSPVTIIHEGVAYPAVAIINIVDNL